MQENVNTFLNENTADLIDVETVFEEDLVLTKDYCESRCAFYKTCYANHTICLRRIFAKALNKLTVREKNIIRSLCGYNGPCMSVAELETHYARSSQKIEMMKERAFHKLRALPYCKTLKHFMFDVFSAQEDHFYAEVMSGIFGITKEDFAELQQDLDFDVLNERAMQKTPEAIKKELFCSVKDFPALRDYAELLQVGTLNELLHTSQKALFLNTFKTDDVAFFKLVHCLEEMGYQFKDTFSRHNVKRTLTAKLLSAVADAEIFSQYSYDVGVKFNTNLSATLNDMLQQMPQLQTNIDEGKFVAIQELLKQKGLIFPIGNTCLEYLSKEKIEVFVYQLAEWMIGNQQSVWGLVKYLEAHGKTPAENLQYICTEYPKFYNADGAVSSSKFNADTPIEDLNLSIRGFNCLKRAGIHTVGELLLLSEDDLRGVRNMGEKSVREIQTVLSQNGLFSITERRKARFNREFLPPLSKERIFVILRNQRMLKDITLNSVCGIHRDEKKGETALLCVTADAFVEYRYYDANTAAGRRESVVNKPVGFIDGADMQAFCDTVINPAEWDTLQINEHKLSVKRPYLEEFLGSTDLYFIHGMRLLLQNNMPALRQFSLHTAKKFCK